MRTLHADLTTSQAADFDQPYLTVVFTKRDNTVTRSYATTDSPNKIVKVQQSESRADGKINMAGVDGTFSMIIRLRDADNSIGQLDHVGYRVDIGWGFNTSSGNKTSVGPPGFVITQREVSVLGTTFVEFTCLSVWDILARKLPYADTSATFLTETDTVRHVLMDTVTDKVDAAISDDGGVQTDDTGDANDAGANDVALLPAAPATNDAFYIGSSVRFDRISIDLTTVGVGTWTITWEYWNGSSWSTLTDIEGNTSFTAGIGAFKTGELQVFAFDAPSNWSTRTESPTVNNTTHVITSSSVANPSNILCVGHNLATGQNTTIVGHSDSVPAINATHVVTVVDADNFTIPVSVTTGGTGGTATDEDLGPFYYVRARVSAFSSITTRPLATRITTSYDWGVQLDTSDAAQGDDFVPLYQSTVQSSRRNIFVDMIGFTLLGVKMRQDGIRLVYVDNAQGSPDFSYVVSGHDSYSSERSTGLIIPNKVIVTNADPAVSVPTAEGSDVDATSSAELGVLAVIIPVPGVSSSKATTQAQRAIKRALRDIQQGTAVVPMNCGQEIWDQVQVTDKRTSVTFKGRVTTLVRSYIPNAGVYNLQIQMGGVVSVSTADYPNRIDLMTQAEREATRAENDARRAAGLAPINRAQIDEIVEHKLALMGLGPQFDAFDFFTENQRAAAAPIVDLFRSLREQSAVEGDFMSLSDAASIFITDLTSTMEAFLNRSGVPLPAPPPEDIFNIT